MKELPILFNGPMVRAILEGRKTQTRRVIKPQPPKGLKSFGWIVCSCPSENEGKAFWADDIPLSRQTHYVRCPYGEPGDRFWVRETFADTAGMGFDKRIYYAADTMPGSDGDQARKDYGVKWKPSIHMPRWASRILLEVVEIRVERIQEIGEEGSLAEGMKAGHMCEPSASSSRHSARQNFAQTWKDLYGNWGTNPWVWVIEFKRVQS